eukprot:4359615-Pyramimonas_sp.AAC.4
MFRSWARQPGLLRDSTLRQSSYAHEAHTMRHPPRLWGANRVTRAESIYPEREPITPQTTVLLPCGAPSVARGAAGAATDSPRARLPPPRDGAAANGAVGRAPTRESASQQRCGAQTNQSV